MTREFIKFSILPFFPVLTTIRRCWCETIRGGQPKRLAACWAHGKNTCTNRAKYCLSEICYFCKEMLTKEQHIAHWLKTSEEDEITMHSLFKDGRYTHSLFFGHLYLEKICKALWVKNNTGNTPPFIHNLVKLLPKEDIGLSESDMSFLDDLNDYQLSGRYPDYTYSLQKQTTKEYTAYCINYIKQISECLRKKI